MANLDSSWQASVIKLAHAGNSRAIAFWINHYLVPQGICAQVVTESAGHLQIRVVCRQVPNRERLVRFICHRLCKLNSEVIRQVRITAQVVGSSAVLWEQSARIIPPTERRTAPTSLEPEVEAIPANQTAPVNQPAKVYAFAHAHPTAHPTVTPADRVGSTVAHAHPTASPIASPEAAAPVIISPNQPTAPPAVPSPVRTPSSRAKAVKPKKAQSKGVSPKAGSRAARSGRSLSFSQQSLSQQSLSQQWRQISRWRPDFQQLLRQLQTQTLETTDRSMQWFASQKSSTRAVMLGGSAVAAFLIGCSFELVGYYADSGTLQQSKATLTGLLRSVPVPSGSIKTAADRTTIIRQPVLNPDDPTISLVFSNNAALTRLSPGQLARQLDTATSTESSPPLVTRIETFRLADMLITNLSDPLGAGLAQPGVGQAAVKSLEADALVSDPFSAVSSTAETGASSESEWTEAAGPDPNAEATQAEDSVDQASEADQAETTAKKAAPLRLQELLANGIDVVNVADSSLTPGSESSALSTDSLTLLQQKQIYPIGAGQNLAEARGPRIFEVKGKRIAYLGYSDSSPRAVSATTAGVNIGVNRQMEEDIKAIRDQVDWIVVNFNWNRELRAYPEDWQVSLTHAAIDHGADLVVGYHPKTTQGAEIYSGRAIVYSLGSLVEEYSDLPAGDYDTAALKVSLKDHMMQLELLPIQVRRGEATVAKGELGTTLLQYLEQASSLFDQPLRSPTSLNSQIRLSLPAAPDAEMPTDPFISYPEPGLGPDPQP